MFYNTGVS